MFIYRKVSNVWNSNNTYWPLIHAQYQRHDQILLLCALKSKPQPWRILHNSLSTPYFLHYDTRSLSDRTISSLFRVILFIFFALFLLPFLCPHSVLLSVLMSPLWTPFSPPTWLVFQSACVGEKISLRMQTKALDRGWRYKWQINGILIRLITESYEA